MAISINLNPSIPALAKQFDKKNVNVRYMLIPPFASAHVYWNSKISELVYEIEEPILTSQEKEMLAKLEEAMLELVNVNVAVEKSIEATTEYIDKTARLLIDELNMNISSESYNKMFYYLFRNFVGFNEIFPLLKDYYIEDIECNGIDTPVYIVHRIYRNLKTNLVFKDLDKLASFVEKLAQRCGRYISYAQPILDGTMPDGSIDYEEPIVYKEGGIVKVSKIGEVIDKFYKNESNKPVSVSGIEVPAFDKDNFKISWKKVDYVYRHKINEEIYELKTEFGKKIKLTGCHSIFKLTKEGLKSERTDKMKEGDYVAFPLQIPVSNKIEEINLAEKMSDLESSKEFVVNNIPEEVYAVKKEALYSFYRENYEKPNQAFYEHKNKKIIPLGAYNLLSREELIKSKIKPTSAVGIKPILKVDKELMFFLGLYVAEGWLSQNKRKVYFCLNQNETDLIERLRKSAKECFNVNIYVEPPVNNAVKIVINSYALGSVLTDILKLSKGAKNKRVPEIVFNVDKELQKEFIEAWIAGDYGSTTSKSLVEDISYLALFNKEVVAFQGRERKSNINGRDIKSFEYYTNFYNREVNNSYSDMIPLEVFNPLRDSHMRLKNKRMNRELLRKTLEDIRYQRMQNIKLANSPKFIEEWTKRGFIEGEMLTQKGVDLLAEREVVNKLIASDLGFARINSIKKVKASSAYVYDFSVKDCENFVGGVGGLCCHNSRVNATYTKDITSHGPTFTIRKFTKIPWTPTQLISLNTMSPEMLAYFWILLENKSSILISGGTASGKTTILNALAFFIPPEARVISIEDTRELALPRENWLPAVARSSVGTGKVGEIDLFDLLKSSFRQTPDYLIVGEIRGKEAFVLFQGMASGHASLSTMHADSVDTLIRRLQTPPIELSPTLVNTLDCVAIATHAIVNKKETRKVREVVEIVNVNKDGSALVNTLFSWDARKDIFFFKRNSKVFEKISVKRGIPLEKLQEEFSIRTKLLYTLYKQKVFGFDEIQSIINEYYKNPEIILKKYGISED